VNVINRLLIIALLLAIILLAIVVVVAPRQTVDLAGQGLDGIGSWFDLWQTPKYFPLFASGRVIIGGALVLLCLLLLWLELRKPKKKTIRVQQVAGGEASISVDSIGQRLAYNIDQLPDVVKVSPQIASRSRGVDVELVLETSPDVDVPMKTEEVLQVTREVVEDRMGLKLGKVEVKIKHAPYPKE
jgi:hypothetical protein